MDEVQRAIEWMEIEKESAQNDWERAGAEWRMEPGTQAQHDERMASFDMAIQALRQMRKPPERKINNERFLELCKQYGFAVQQDSQSPGIFLRQKDGTLREVTCFTPENEGSK